MPISEMHRKHLIDYALRYFPMSIRTRCETVNHENDTKLKLSLLLYEITLSLIFIKMCYSFYGLRMG